MNKMNNCTECYDRFPTRDLQKFTYMGYVCNDCSGIADLETENRRLKEILRKRLTSRKWRAKAKKKAQKLDIAKAKKKAQKWKEAKEKNLRKLRREAQRLVVKMGRDEYPKQDERV